MGFFKKLVKGVGKAIKGVGKVVKAVGGIAAPLVEKLNIPIVSGVAGFAGKLLGGTAGKVVSSAGKVVQVTNTAKAVAQSLALKPMLQNVAEESQSSSAQSAAFGGSKAGISVTVSDTEPSWFSKKTKIFGQELPNWAVFIAIPGGLVVLVFLAIKFLFKRRRR